jgi:uncharacterized membrane-anchored protein
MRSKLMVVGLFLGSYLALMPLHAEMTPIKGPAVGKLADIAEIKIPEGFAFYEKKDMKEFMETTHNFYSNDQLGVLVNFDQTAGYIALFSFDEIGYIKDAASEKLDADAMWKEMLENNIEANKERKEKGWEEMELVSWEVKPQYNSQTQRLEWAERLKEKAGELVNYNTRVLGRKGVMRVTLVPNSDLQTVLSGFNDTIGGFDFVTGSKYAEWTTGDKIADIGLAALVVGGAGALAAKTGLLGKLWGLLVVAGVKLWAVLAAAFVGLWKYIKGFFGGRSDDKKPPSSLVQ